MNNSDYNDFSGWQNDEENDMRNPNNWIPKGGFFYYGPMSEEFKKMWNQQGNQDNFMEHLKDYLNFSNPIEKLERSNKNKRQPKISKNKTTIFSQDDYLKLIEIRGYLAINEQFAHVKALDKLLNQIQIIPKDSK
jgi:hypothetical protein